MTDGVGQRLADRHLQIEQCGLMESKWGRELAHAGAHARHVLHERGHIDPLLPHRLAATGDGLQSREGRVGVRGDRDARGEAKEPGQLEHSRDVGTGSREHEGTPEGLQHPVEPHQQAESGTVGVGDVLQIEHDAGATGLQGGLYRHPHLRYDRQVQFARQPHHARGGTIGALESDAHLCTTSATRPRRSAAGLAGIYPGLTRANAHAATPSPCASRPLPRFGDPRRRRRPGSGRPGRRRRLASRPPRRRRPPRAGDRSPRSPWTPSA
jgi:hypothetical protein